MITVHGYLGTVEAAVADRARHADLVVAPSRVLDALGVPDERRIVLGAVSAAIERLASATADLDVRVFASGDPLFFGVVRRLRAAGLTCRIEPAVSSVAAAFAAVGLPWDDAVVVSAHGRDLAPAAAVCRARPKVAVLTSPASGAVQLAEALADLDRWYVVAERLGTPEQQVRVVDGPGLRAADDVGHPHVVLVLAHPVDDAAAIGETVAFAGGHREPPRAPDLSPSPVAVPAGTVFAWLRPTLGDLVWVRGDVGRAVGSLAEQYGAAALDLDAGGAVGTPSYVVSDDARDGANIAVPRVLVSDTPGPGAHRIDVSIDGTAHTTYLTMISAEDAAGRTTGAAP